MPLMSPDNEILYQPTRVEKPEQEEPSHNEGARFFQGCLYALGVSFIIYALLGGVIALVIMLLR